jgi:hypothetical protein
VFTYPLSVQLTFPQQQPIGAFRFGITGPPGVYQVYSSTNLTVWESLNSVDNPLGQIFFTDTEAHLSSQKFYSAQLQSASLADLLTTHLSRAELLRYVLNPGTR